jgi:Protein of unknown function (DUF1194)
MKEGIAMRLAASLAGLTFATLLPGDAHAQTPVDVELVLAVDVSQSMDRGEHELQRQGYVAALQHPQVLSAIRAGIYGRVAIAYVEWGATQIVMTPWALIDGAATARGFAEALAAEPIRTIHGTSISGALSFAASLFKANGYDGFRRVIDVSGDGPNSAGAPVVPARDAALGQGLIINGLPIMLRQPANTFYSIPDLDIYYADCVIGGPGSFVLPVDDAGQLADAIRQKLVLEIAGAPLHLTPAALTGRTPRIDCLIGEKLRRGWQGPYP